VVCGDHLKCLDFYLRDKIMYNLQNFDVKAFGDRVNGIGRGIGRILWR